MRTIRRITKMLRLNVNEAKELTFEVQIGGVHGEQIDSFFRIVFEDVEYGFPAKVGRESITVALPPLNQVVGKKIKEGDEAEVKLEIIADGHYLTPWSDRAKMSNPLVIEAKIRDDGFIPNPTLKTQLVVSEDGAKQKTTVKEDVATEEDLTDRIVSKLSEKFADLIKPKAEVKSAKMEVVKEACKKTMKEEDEEGEGEEQADEAPAEKIEEKEDVSENEPLTTGAMEKILSQTIQKLGLYTEDSRTTKKKKEVTLDEFKKNLTKEDIYKYMERAGAKNPKIQEIVYEQAVLAAKKNTPIEVLRQVISIMKKQKS
jgi:hypothetical protein